MMSIVDALSILGSGVARGYRGSQELQRQLAEAKRKALIEERDLAIREGTAAAQNALAAAQTREAGLGADTKEFTLGEARAEATRNATPILSTGFPRLSIAGREFNLPNRLDTLTNPELSRLFLQSSDERFKDSHPGYFTNYPPAGTAAAEIKTSPRARKIDYLLKAAGAATAGGPTQFETLDDTKDAYNSRVASTFNFILDQMKLADPEAFGDSAVVDTTNRGNKNRFRGVVVHPGKPGKN